MEQDLAKEALIAALRQSAAQLASGEAEPTADARGARRLQLEIRHLMEEAGSKEVRFHAFWLTAIVEDIFYNLFGDTPYREDTERARGQICSDLRQLFLKLAEALSAGDRLRQADCWMDFTTTYLDRLESINRHGEGGENS